ncbi:hypothetical protein [Clostridium botulinum]|uniref:hypothetical protein n=1 Tax=Clostridium botulinum TaxID=1491 RepID=UPI00046FE7E2|nr:hypothetical protein [Clostridium botulinum]QDY18248.1 hypothetical protein CGQ27_14590 [Clostridium botulinum]
MANIYNLKEERLLRKSKVYNDHNMLQQILNNYTKTDRHDPNKVSNKEKIFLHNVYPKLLRQAINEWKPDLTKRPLILDKREIKCEICSAKLKNICFIKNKYNDNEMKIGFNCYKHFSINGQKDMKQLLEESIKLKKIEKFNYEIPGLEDKLNNWDNFIEKEKIYVFRNIKDMYICIRNDIRKLYNEYITNKTNTNKRECEIIAKIKKLLVQAQHEKEKIIDYINDNRENYLIPTKEMINELKTKENLMYLKWIEEDKIITFRTLYRFNNFNFSQKLIPYFNRVLIDYEIEIKEAYRNQNTLGYNLIIRKNKDTKIFCSYKNLCYMFGGFITGEENIDAYNYRDVIEKSKLIDNNSIEYGLYLLNNILGKYDIEIEEYFEDYDEVIWKKNKTYKLSNGTDKIEPKYYIITKIKNISNVLIDILYKTKEYKNKELYDILINNSETKGISDTEEIIKRRNKY